MYPGRRQGSLSGPTAPERSRKCAGLIRRRSSSGRIADRSLRGGGAKLLIRKGASSASDARAAARELHASIYDPNASLSVFFCSPRYDLPALAAELRSLFGKVPLIGCTTAGEISPLGYLNG